MTIDEKLDAIMRHLGIPSGVPVTGGPQPPPPPPPPPITTTPAAPVTPGGVNEFPFQQGAVYHHTSPNGHVLDYAGAMLGIDAQKDVPFSIPIIAPADRPCTAVRLTFQQGRSNNQNLNPGAMEAWYNGSPHAPIWAQGGAIDIPINPGQRSILTLLPARAGSFVVASRFV